MTRLKTTLVRAAVFAGLCAVAVTAAADTLDAQTRKNIETAMRSEAYASLKYLGYAKAARAHGNEKLARLFEESADVEANHHFVREAAALGLPGPDIENISDAIVSEYDENNKMYNSFAEQAAQVGDHKTAALFRQIAAEEGDHYQAYKDALMRTDLPATPAAKPAAREVKRSAK